MDRVAYVEALRAERAQYVAAGLKARAAEVDAELARFDEAPAAPVVEDTSARRGKRG